MSTNMFTFTASQYFRNGNRGKKPTSTGPNESKKSTTDAPKFVAASVSIPASSSGSVTSEVPDYDTSFGVTADPVLLFSAIADSVSSFSSGFPSDTWVCYPPRTVSDYVDLTMF